MKLAILSAAIAGASAFAPSTTAPQLTALRMSEVEEVAEPAMPEVELVAPLNYWVPDESAPCFCLPGAVAPLGFFDPLGFSKGKDVD